MGTILILINGMDLPYSVMDKAIPIDREKRSKILAIFLQGKKEQKEGYAFPSDLDAAEKGISEEETLKEDKEIISHNSQVVSQMAKSAGLEVESKIIEEPKMEDLRLYFDNADQILIAKDFDEELLLEARSITLQDIIEYGGSKVEFVEKE